MAHGQLKGVDASAALALPGVRGVVLAAIGSAVGLALSLLLTRSIESLLFDVSRTDVLTMVGATVLMLAIAFGLVLAVDFLQTRNDKR